MYPMLRENWHVTNVMLYLTNAVLGPIHTSLRAS